MSLPGIQIHFLRRLLRQKADRQVAKALEKLKAADLVQLYNAIGPAERNMFILSLFQIHRAGEMLSEMPEGLISSTLENIDDSTLSRILGRLAFHDAGVLLDQIPEERQQKLLSMLPEDKKTDLEDYILYPPDSCGQVMTKNFLALPDDMTVGDAISKIKVSGEELDAGFYCFVVNGGSRLVGVLSMRQLIMAADEKPLKKVMVSDIISVSAQADQEEALKLAAKYDFFAVPVVDADRKLLGVITIDDLVDVLEEEATEDMYALAGLDTEDRVFSPVHQSLIRRLPWMVISIGTSFLAAIIISFFEATIAEAVVLASFMPIVAGMGGSAGSQSLTVVTRGIALGEIDFTSGVRAIGKELAVGVCLGAIMGLLVGGVGYLWRGEIKLGIVLFLSMSINLGLGAFIGTCIPLVLKRLGYDPALGGGVFVTAICDSLGFLTFLSLASVILLA